MNLFDDLQFIEAREAGIDPQELVDDELKAQQDNLQLNVQAVALQVLERNTEAGELIANLIDEVDQIDPVEPQNAELARLAQNILELKETKESLKAEKEKAARELARMKQYQQTLLQQLQTLRSLPKPKAASSPYSAGLMEIGSGAANTASGQKHLAPKGSYASRYQSVMDARTLYPEQQSPHKSAPGF